MILDEFKTNSEMTVEQGVERIVEEDLLVSFKWMKNIDKYVNDMYTLSAPNYQRMLINDADTISRLRSLKRAITQLLDIVENS